MSSSTLPTPPEGFDYLSVVVPVRIDRPMTAVEREGLRRDVAEAAERALDARIGGVSA